MIQHAKMKEAAALLGLSPEALATALTLASEVVRLAIQHGCPDQSAGGVRDWLEKELTPYDPYTS